MKRLKRWWIEAGHEMSHWVIVLMIIGFIYPWLAKGVEMVYPFIVKYYDWVSKF